MLIALSGTPGTGKTTISRILRQHYHIIDLNQLVIHEELYSGKDEKRDSYLVDIEKIKKRIKHTNSKADVIIEGHFSHLLDVDAVILLRTSPQILEKRLEKKGISLKKIKENVEAEAVDVILVEAVEGCSKVFEIDTTNKTPQEVTACVIYIIECLKNGKIPEKFLPGKINWLELIHHMT